MKWHCTRYLFWVCSYLTPIPLENKQSNKTHTTVNWITFVSNTMASSRFFLVAASLLMAIMFSAMITSSRATKQLTKKQTLKPKFFGQPFPKPGLPQFPRPGGFPTNPMPFPQFPKPGFPQLPGQGFPKNPMPFPQFPKPGFPQFPGFGFPKFPQFPKPGSPSFPPATPTISTPPSIPVTPTLSNWNFSSKLI